MSTTAPGNENKPRLDDPYAALRLPDYRLYSFSASIAVIGAQIQAVALGYELYARTKDPMALAYVGLARAVPFFLFGLFAGQIADWFNRKYLVMSSHVVSILCALGIAALSYYEGPVWMFYLVLFLRGTANIYGMPARQAMLPQVVPPEVFPNAITWNSGLFHLALVIGPAIGGVIIGQSVPLAYVVDAACLFAACTSLGLVKLRPITTQREPASIASLLAGAKFVFNTKIILATMTLDLFAVLLGGATALLPIYASKEYLDVGATGLGWLRSAPAVGSCVMAVLLVYLPPMQHAGRMLLWMVAGFGAATIVFGLSTNFWLSLFMLFLTGAFDQVSVVVRHTLIQLLSPDHMRGRISAVNSIFIGASNQLGELESGAVAKLWGPVASVVSGGIGTIIVVGVTAIRWPQVLKIGRLEDAKAEELAPELAEKDKAAAVSSS